MPPDAQRRPATEPDGAKITGRGIENSVLPALPSTEASADIALALVTALGKLGNPRRDGWANGGTFSYEYVTLGALLALVRPVLARHGLALITPISDGDNGVTVSAVFLHSSGATFEAGRLTLARGRAAQATGSAITYARRYVAMAALGLAPDDDDGAAASPKPRTRSARKGS